VTTDGKPFDKTEHSERFTYYFYSSLVVKDIDMLQIIYLIAFTILAFLAIGNLIRSLIGFSVDASQPRSMANSNMRYGYRNGVVPHPELLDDMGNVTSEPLLIMKSISVEDARARLDALYHNDAPSAAEGES
jgi:hypothetical protein